MTTVKSWLTSLQEINDTGPCEECDGKGQLQRISWKRFDTALEPVVEGYEDCQNCKGTGELIIDTDLENQKEIYDLLEKTRNLIVNKGRPVDDSLLRKEEDLEKILHELELIEGEL